MLALLAILAPALAVDSNARGDDHHHEVHEDPIPLNRIWLHNATYASVNAVGLGNTLQVGWKHRLFDSESLLLHHTHTFIGPSITATPASLFVGVYGEVQPVTPIRLFAEVMHTSYLGTFGTIQSFDDERSDFDASSLRNIEGEAERGVAWNVGLTLRGAGGPVAGRTSTQLVASSLDLEPGQLTYIDPVVGRPVRPGELTLFNRTELFVHPGDVYLGGRLVWYDGLDPLQGDPASSQVLVGPMGVWQIHVKNPGAAFNHPTVFLAAQWWARHPYLDLSSGPTVAMGFAFSSDLWMSSR